MSNFHSWEWACTKLLEGRRVRWKDWNLESWIQADWNGVIVRFSRIAGRIHRMSDFTLTVRKILEDNWVLYERSQQCIQQQILFRKFDKITGA